MNGIDIHIRDTYFVAIHWRGLIAILAVVTGLGLLVRRALAR